MHIYRITLHSGLQAEYGPYPDEKPVYRLIAQGETFIINPVPGTPNEWVNHETVAKIEQILYQANGPDLKTPLTPE